MLHIRVWISKQIQHIFACCAVHVLPMFFFSIIARLWELCRLTWFGRCMQVRREEGDGVFPLGPVIFKGLVLSRKLKIIIVCLQTNFWNHIELNIQNVSTFKTRIKKPLKSKFISISNLIKYFFSFLLLFFFYIWN